MTEKKEVQFNLINFEFPNSQMSQNNQVEYEFHEEIIEGEDLLEGENNIIEYAAIEVDDQSKNKKFIIDKPKPKLKEQKSFEDDDFMKWQIKEMCPFIDNSDFEYENGDKTKIFTKNNKDNYSYGAIFDGENYYIGEFTDGKPCGLIRKFGVDKIFVMEGQMHNGFKFDDGIAEKYFDTGERYYGEIKDEKMNGKGEYTFLNGDIWQGTFENDKLNGTGSLLKNKGFTQYTVEFANNKVKSFERPKIQDKFYKPYPNTMKFLSKEEQNTLFSYLNEVPPVLASSPLKWIESKNTEKNIHHYLGQINRETKLKEGRGILCKIFFDENHYYVGQFKNNKKNGYGFILDNSNDSEPMKLEYEGFFLNDEYSGEGTIYKNDYKYNATFCNGKLNGFGRLVNYQYKDLLLEGVYKDGNPYRILKTNKEGLNTKKLIYDGNGNLISEDSEIDLESPDLNRDVLINKAKIKIAHLKSNPQMNEIEKIIPLVNKANFQVVHRYMKEGLYIGEINNLSQRSGRGKLINLWNKKYYLGYWLGNKMDIFGGIFDKSNKPIYIGQFRNGKKYGQGIYFLNKSNVFGIFDSNGSGYQAYIGKDGTIKKGDKVYYAKERWDEDVFFILDKINSNEENLKCIDPLFDNFKEIVDKVIQKE